MNTSFFPENIVSQDVIQDKLKKQDSSDILKGINTRRQLFEQSTDNLKYLNLRKDSFVSCIQGSNEQDVSEIPNVRKQSSIIKNPNNSVNSILHPTTNIGNNRSPNNKQTCVLQYNLPSPQLKNRFLKKVELVKQFVHILKGNTPGQIFKKIQKAHYYVIDDQAYIPIEKQINIFHQFSKNIYNKIQKIKPFLPNSLYMIIWEIILFMLAIIFAWISTVEIALQKLFAQTESDIQYIQFMIVYAFSIDIVLNLNKAYYEGFTIIEEKGRIIKNYFRRHLLMDILPIVGFFLARGTNIWFFQLTSIFRIFKMINLKKKIEENFHLQERFPTTATLIKLVFLILFMAHLCGCGFLYVAQSQAIEVETWLDRQKLTDAEWHDQYVVSLYYAFITMITVGYGDVVPVTINERIYTILMTLFACGIFAYAVNTIGQIFQQIEQQNAKTKKDKFEIRNYMEGRSIKKDIQQKIFKYLEQLALIEKESNNYGMLILQKLPQNLKNEIYQDFYGKILREQKFFTNNFSIQLNELLALKMNEQIIGPGQIIYNKGDFDRNVYMIKKGEVSMFDVFDKSERNLGLINVNYNFL